MNRRTFIKKTTLGTLGLGLATGIYSWQIEPYWVEFTERKMSLLNLSKNLENKLLVQISDIHIGTRFDYQYILKAFQKIQKLNPDFVVYTGDFVNYKDTKQFNQLQETLPHFPKGKLGTFGVLGNHDYGKNWQETDVANKITSLLEGAEINILRNESKIIDGLNFIGFDDFWSPNFDNKTLVNNYKPDHANLVLCHNPDVCDLGIWQNFKGWILAGHTHGGQCKPPFLPAPILPVKNKRYSAGEIQLNPDQTLYINRAIGHLWPVRFNARPEITLFTLQKNNPKTNDYFFTI